MKCKKYCTLDERDGACPVGCFSLQFTTAGDDDLLRGGTLLATNRLDFIHHIHTFDYLAEDHVLVVQEVCGYRTLHKKHTQMGLGEGEVCSTSTYMGTRPNGHSYTTDRAAQWRELKTKAHTHTHTHTQSHTHTQATKTPSLPTYDTELRKGSVREIAVRNTWGRDLKRGREDKHNTSENTYSTEGREN
jgi:hypothetical protein